MAKTAKDVTLDDAIDRQDACDVLGISPRVMARKHETGEAPVHVQLRSGAYVYSRTACEEMVAAGLAPGGQLRPYRRRAGQTHSYMLRRPFKEAVRNGGDDDGGAPATAVAPAVRRADADAEDWAAGATCM